MRVFTNNRDNQRVHGVDGIISTPKNSTLYKMMVAFAVAYICEITRVRFFYFNHADADDLGNPISRIFNSDYGRVCEHGLLQINDMIDGRNMQDKDSSQVVCPGEGFGFVAINGDGLDTRKSLQDSLPTELVQTRSKIASKVSKEPHYLSGRDTMVHLFEWKWKDIASECENFLGPRGFGGVQVSPPTEHIVVEGRPWWERYQPVSYVLVTRSGDEAAFRDMIKRCNAVGVRIYVDAVINHMSGPLTTGFGTAGSSADYEDRHWPAVPYTLDNMNTPVCLIENYEDANEVRNCELLGLSDLNQGKEDTRVKITAYMNGLIDMGVAGFRIDAAKHIWPADLEVIYNRLDALNTDHGFAADVSPFVFQEVINNVGGVVSALEYVGLATVTEFNHGSELSRAFSGNNELKWLANWGEAWGLLDSADAFVFIDNHDTQRFQDVLTYKNPKPYKMAIAFMLAHTYGIPNIISSYDFKNFDDPPPADSSGNLLSPIINTDNTCGNGYNCEHRWRQIFNMIEFRNTVEGTFVNDWWDNGNNQIAFCRGGLGFVAFNLDTYDFKHTLYTCLSAGTYCDVISGELENGRCTGKTVHVRADGKAYIEILTTEEDGVLAIHANGKLYQEAGNL